MFSALKFTVYSVEKLYLKNPKLCDRNEKRKVWNTLISNNLLEVSNKMFVTSKFCSSLL